jgi:predicted P-loop ATPase/GTPase
MNPFQRFNNESAMNNNIEQIDRIIAVYEQQKQTIDRQIMTWMKKRESVVSKLNENKAKP